MVNLNNIPLILASQSPRRLQLLKMLGINFQVIASTVDESKFKEQDPVSHVLNLSRLKAQDVAQNIARGIVVGADTIVVLASRIIGKPQDTAEARSFLELLSGQTHEVYTGFTLIHRPDDRYFSDYEVTRVHFRVLQSWEIDYYVDTQSPMDKAGAYGIQDLSAIFVDRIEGCFYNVVGFPLAKFYQSLQNFLKN